MDITTRFHQLADGLSLRQRVGGYFRPMSRSDDDPLKHAKRRGEERTRQLLRAYPLLSISDVAKHLRRPLADVQQLDQERCLLAVPYHGERQFPAFQFEADGVLAGLPDVLRALHEINDWTAFNFLVTPDLRLNGRTPLEVLRDGNVRDAVWAASAYGNQEPA